MASENIIDVESDYTRMDTDDTDYLSSMEYDILKVLNTYITIMKYLLHKPSGRKKEFKKNIKKAMKMRKSLLEGDGKIKKYLDEEGQYYDLL